MNKTKLTFAGFVVAASGVGIGVTISPGGQEQSIEVTDAEIVRLGRDAATAKKLDADDPILRQLYVVEEKVWEELVSLRVLRDKIIVSKDAVDPPDDGIKYGTPATMPAEAPVGATSNIGYDIQGGKLIVYASARMEAGQYAVMHAHDTSDWSETVAGDAIQGIDGDGVIDYHLTLWIDIEPGKTYQIQVWVNGYDKEELRITP